MYIRLDVIHECILKEFHIHRISPEFTNLLSIVWVVWVAKECLCPGDDECSSV